MILSIFRCIFIPFAISYLRACSFFIWSLRYVFPRKYGATVMEKRTAGIIPFIHEPCHPRTQRSLHKFLGILLVKVECCSRATFKKKVPRLAKNIVNTSNSLKTRCNIYVFSTTIDKYNFNNL